MTVIQDRGEDEQLSWYGMGLDHVGRARLFGSGVALTISAGSLDLASTNLERYLWNVRDPWILQGFQVHSPVLLGSR